MSNECDFSSVAIRLKDNRDGFSNFQLQKLKKIEVLDRIGATDVDEAGFLMCVCIQGGDSYTLN